MSNSILISGKLIASLSTPILCLMIPLLLLIFSKFGNYWFDFIIFIFIFFFFLFIFISVFVSFILLFLIFLNISLFSTCLFRGNIAFLDYGCGNFDFFRAHVILFCIVKEISLETWNDRLLQSYSIFVREYIGFFSLHLFILHKKVHFLFILFNWYVKIPPFLHYCRHKVLPHQLNLCLCYRNRLFYGKNDFFDLYTAGFSLHFGVIAFLSYPL